MAAVEFALLFPVMVALMLGMVDASNALIAYRRITVAAEETALIASELSVQADGSTSLTTTQLYNAATAIFGVIPGLEASGSTQPFSVTVSAVIFTPVSGRTVSSTQNCYTANVAWSVPLCSFASGSVSRSFRRRARNSTLPPIRPCSLLRRALARHSRRSSRTT